MIASKGARGCFARAMHNGVNNGTDAAENSECTSVILRLPEPWSAKRGSGGGRRRISSFPSCVESTGFQPESRMLRSFGVLRHLRLRLRASGSLRMTAVSSPELRYEREVRKVSVPPFDLPSVPDVRALGAVECDEIDGQIDGAGVRPVDERDELERGGILLAELC